jgi:hypothetical protein
MYPSKKNQYMETLFVSERNWMCIVDTDILRSDDFYRRNMSELKC